ncbi:MAG: Fur family transcriptional regulator [Candidatus Saccharimonadales bacterium]
MFTPKEVFAKLLKDSRQSVTGARVSVFEALLGREPMSMHELVARTNGVDRASVYRAVGLFERLGIVQRLSIGWKYKIELTDRFAEHHHHLTCTACGKTIAMGEAELESLIAKLAAEHNFTPTAHQIEVQGLCNDCAATTRQVPGRT